MQGNPLGGGRGGVVCRSLGLLGELGELRGVRVMGS